ncbi:putative adenosylhomocysteinase 3 [Sarcoptes scabiei]|nr:putative adenosylhomocysteinase 3 [Sarcoptes scabiei]
MIELIRFHPPLLFHLIVLISLNELFHCLPISIPIGALFTTEQLEEQQAFQLAIEHFNSHLERNGSHYEPLIKIIDPQNNLFLYDDVCVMLQQTPVAILGPFFNNFGAAQLQSICEHYEIPHIEARMLVDFKARTDLSINLYPHQSLLAKVFHDLIESLDWNRFVIIYEDSESVIHFSEYMKQSQERQREVRIFQLQPDQSYREILWQIKATEITNVVLDINTEHILEVLKQAQQSGMLSEQHKYLITSLDLHTLDLEAYRHSRTNITWLKIVQEQHPYTENLRLLAKARNYERSMQSDSNAILIPPMTNIKSVSAMIFDAMEIITSALIELNDIKLLGSIDCNLEQKAWHHGSTIINYIRQVAIEGITGWVGFDESGFRANLTFDIVTTTEDSYEQIGYWKNGMIFRTNNWYRHLSSREQMTLVKVTTVLNDPFVMNARSSKELRGNDRYEGFVPDLMKEISKLLNIRFEINLVKDGAYGAVMNATSNDWNGMIGEVMRGEADIAVADLTINSNREQAVDFTYPFMSTGISIIYKKPTTKETSLWSFLSPFSTAVWICLLGAIVGISLIFFYVGRFTPYEWCNPHPCIHHDPVLENACNMRNSFWCSIGSLMQQGSDVAPKFVPTLKFDFALVFVI